MTPGDSTNGNTECLQPFREQARRLLAEGMTPHALTQTLGRHMLAAGVTTPPALVLVRELPGLAEYDPLDDWQADIRAATANDPYALVAGLD
jgi:hypothetical protein